MGSLHATLRDLSDEYLALHVAKEDAFWTAKMGLAPDSDAASRALASAEIAWSSWLSDPARLASLKSVAREGGGDEQEKHVLGGWIAMLSAHVVEGTEARDLAAKIVDAEQALQRARYAMELGFVDPDTGKLERASSVKLILMLRTERDERRRRAAFAGLRSIETHVLDHGFLELVAMRNRLARLLGHEDYYAWRVAAVERQSKAYVFGLLDALERATREHAKRELDRFAKEKGEDARQPWSYGWLRTGALTERIDPYFRFEDALSRWARAFAALGVRFRGATLTLDLVDRRGKYENGFMHGPEPTFYDGAAWHPARIQFTANAVPGIVGSGLVTMETLFHEGGHAAHFANIVEGAPCFSQEFAPTSVAYAETQSMFMDSLLSDADFRTRYAAMPEALVLDAIRETQPFRAADLRAMMTVPLAERALYELPERELDGDRVLAMFRRIEHEVQFLEAGPRPVLATPHLLAGESSAYYHGYVLAEMAVEQTRGFFLARDGYLTDNARIGPDLAKSYWARGNALGFDETLRTLTGNGLSPDALAATVTRPVEDELARARASIAAAKERPAFDGPVDLDARVRIAHGNETLARFDSPAELPAACERFAAWVRDAEARAKS